MRGFATNLIDRVESNNGEHKVGNAGDYDIEEHVANLIASLLKDFLGIVEDDIRAAPLLEDGDEDAKKQDGSVAGKTRPKDCLCPV